MRIRDIRYQQKIFITELTEKKINMISVKRIIIFYRRLLDNGVAPTELPQRDCHNGVATTGLPQQCCPNGVTPTGLPQRGCPNSVAPTVLPQQCCPNGVASCEQSINLDRWVLSVNQHVSLFYSSQNNGGDRTRVTGGYCLCTDPVDHIKSNSDSNYMKPHCQA
jgi:hypothetical protein